MTRALVASAAAAVALALVPAAASSAPPAGQPAAAAGANAAPPSLQVHSAIAVDAHTGQVIWSLRPDAREAIASTTKMMTALVTLDRTAPDEVLTAPGYAAGPEEVTIGLAPGERMTVHDLLLAMLLPSANDAAVTLARGVGGTTAAFVGEMNARAAQLGLTGTHYSTPVGLDSASNYSTARDLSRLGSYLLTNPVFAHDVDLPSAPLRSGSHPRVVVNRNSLVAQYPFVKGIKTGHTLDAGYVLVGAAAQGGAEVVTAVLGDSSEAQSAADSLALMRYALGRYQTVTPLAAGQIVARPAVRYYGDHVGLVATRAVQLTAVQGASISTRVNAPGTITGPKPRGYRAGSVTVYNDGHPVATVPLVTASRVQAAGFLRRLGPVADAGLAALAFLVLSGAGVARIVSRRRRAARGERAADDHHSHAQRGYR